MTADVVVREAHFRSASGSPGWSASLRNPAATHVAWRTEEVVAVLARADAAARTGRYAVVLVAYEAAGAFDAAMRTAPPLPDVPLAIVAEFDSADLTAPRDAVRADEPDPQPGARPHLEPLIEHDAFTGLVERIHEHIREGDSYQVNLTFQMQGPAPQDPARWFDRLCLSQRAGYAARIDLGRFDVLSLSPELFFERSGSRLVARPMKGTSPRGRWRAEDAALSQALATSDKAHAENVMIVDLLRNDIGRVAVTGSVRVPALFSLERYPTLWQLTSTIEATLPPHTTTVDIFQALFPCGSVTGAPKIETMRIITGLEQVPRGLYTGAIGLVRPGGDCCFSVAIRTLVVDRATGVTSMGVGAGITIDSDPVAEYAECLLKAAFAEAPARATPEFSLLETMRLEDGRLQRVERHLDRMRDSAVRFDYPWRDQAIRALLGEAAAARPDGLWRVRLLVSSSGEPSLTCEPHVDTHGVWRVAFANAPVDERDPLLFNKTTARTAYDAARRGRPDVDDVVLWNARGEVTESTIANIIAEIDGVQYTPPVTSGLLAGVMRTTLIESGEVQERVLTRGALARASRLWLVNSLRGRVEATLVR